MTLLALYRVAQEDVKEKYSNAMVAMASIQATEAVNYRTKSKSINKATKGSECDIDKYQKWHHAGCNLNN